MAISKYYNDVIMGAMASQITSLAIVYWTVYSGADKKNIKAPRHWPLCGEFTGDRWIPVQMASNADFPFDDVIMMGSVMQNKLPAFIFHEKEFQLQTLS